MEQIDKFNIDEFNIDPQEIIEKATAINNILDEVRRNERLKVLEAYNKWLLKEGYTDTDIIYELDINDFLKEYLNGKA